MVSYVSATRTVTVAAMACSPDTTSQYVVYYNSGLTYQADSYLFKLQD